MKSENLKKKWQDPEYREHMRKAHLGQKAWNKGKKTGLVPKTAFKKGHKPSENWLIAMGKTRGRKQSAEIVENRASKTRGDKHYRWLGDKVGYLGVHAWVIKWKGQPDTCENCGKSGLSARKIHWANIDHKYRRVLEDYIRLCAKCHLNYDKKHGYRK